MAVFEKSRSWIYTCVLLVREIVVLSLVVVSRVQATTLDDPEKVASMVSTSIHYSTKRKFRQLQGYPSSCVTGNSIDDCWRWEPTWYNNRKRLADCAIGFGRNATRGRDGRFYVVTDPSDDDAVNPMPGTLRHAVIQSEPLWIVFQRDMVIQLKQELIMNSYKTIDGRRANVHIAYGACITIQYITNVIIHGLHIHDCKPTGNAMVRSSPSHYGFRGVADGDAVSIFGSSNVWIDHDSLSNCADGLVDVADLVKYPYSNQVTERTASGGESEWKNWNWRSEGDVFLNGSYFVESGAAGAANTAAYAKASSYVTAKTSSMVRAITSAAGALTCRKNHMCH